MPKLLPKCAANLVLLSLVSLSPRPCVQVEHALANQLRFHMDLHTDWGFP